MYIHERADWTHFRWDDSRASLLIEEIGRKQGLLYGRLSNIGFDNKIKAMAENLTKDVVYSSEIEGIRLNEDEVRSSIARKLGIDNVKFTAPSHYVDSVVAVMLEAVEHYDQKLTEEKLCQWQSAFFPLGFSEGAKIEVGIYRTHEEHIACYFSDVEIVQEDSAYYLVAMFRGMQKVHERILALDAERYEKGDLPMGHLLDKYCSFLVR